jgi:predicted nuclease with TOPRIM domain
MSFWTAIVVIAAILAVAEVMKTKHRARHGIMTDHMGNEEPLVRENTELKREIEDLRERVKVLERIATEDRETKRLSAEIESLRDK